MDPLLKAERYISQIGTTETFARIEELIRGMECWPEKFRTHVTATHDHAAKTVYGSTAREAVEKAVEYISLAMSVTNPIV